MTFITGAFSATFNGKNLGTTQDGYEQITTRVEEEIRVDQYRGMVDGVFQGIDMILRAVFMEVDMPGVRDMIWPYDHDNDGILFEAAGIGKVGATGQLLSSLCAPLVLTPCGGTTAATKGNPKDGSTLTSITYGRVVLAAEANSIKFAASLRKLPVTLLVLPVPDSDPAPGALAVCSGPMSYYTIL